MGNLRESILAINDRKIEPVEVPNWGLTVYVRTLSVLERLKYEKDLERLGRDSLKWLYVSYALCEQDGTPIFTPGQLDELHDRDPFILDKIFDAATDLLPDVRPSPDGATPEGES